ncbi:hypothetical protein NDU88_007739 [Pleurodeles waltl]|uniref:Uncharacterized protein n=1 Tax=Pleurodeles waltl TaxID=8319 RepID=A0AAV7N771_PLEWA|nr:hypothetical protein NDU88_007739 [Pleurodeles waltl]
MCRLTVCGLARSGYRSCGAIGWFRAILELRRCRSVVACVPLWGNGGSISIVASVTTAPVAVSEQEGEGGLEARGGSAGRHMEPQQDVGEAWKILQVLQVPPGRGRQRKVGFLQRCREKSTFTEVCVTRGENGDYRALVGEVAKTSWNRTLRMDFCQHRTN